MVTAVANTQMAAAWDGDEGDEWARDWRRYDRAVAGYHGLLLDAAGIAATDRVLDIGCGNGQTSRDAARAAAAGRVLGVDLSSRMVERAAELARVDRLDNVAFMQADAQVHPFDAGAADVVVSRFGAMFFDDPVAAFTNIGAGVRPGGRLALVGWRAAADNEWLRCVFTALAVGRDLPLPPPGSPGPFGLADPDRTRATLTAAGFVDIDLTAVDRPFWMGTDADDAFDFFAETGIVRGLTADLDGWQFGQAIDALHATIIDHETACGVEFGSGSWLITARKDDA